MSANPPALPQLLAQQQALTQQLAQRGFAVPMTAPLLGGVRIRAGTHPRLGFLLPNLDGTRGYRLLDWAGVRQLCAPTLHDLRLAQFIDRLPVLNAATIRWAAQLVAAEGFAGEAAADLVRHRRVIPENNRIARRMFLLRRIAQRSGDSQWSAAPCLSPAGSQAAAAWEATGVHRVATLRGLTFETVARAVEELSHVFAAIGDTGASRPRRLIEMLRGCHLQWQSRALSIRTGRSGGIADPVTDQDADQLRAPVLTPDVELEPDAMAAREAMACDYLATLAGRALEMADRQLSVMQGACDDAVALLELWRADPAAPGIFVAPLSLCLDGWERICLLWADRGGGGDRPEAATAALVAELAHFASLLPDVQPASDTAQTTPAQGGVPRPDSWFPLPRRELRGLSAPGITGDEPQRIARNEHIRCSELAFDLVDETRPDPSGRAAAAELHTA